MENGKYELGTLVWIDFDFPDDEKHTFHPAIVLQDQGDKIAVISGSSNNTPEHLVIRNEQFTSFELTPYHLDDNYEFISHTTYFKLDEVKGIKKNMIAFFLQSVTSLPQMSLGTEFDQEKTFFLIN